MQPVILLAFALVGLLSGSEASQNKTIRPRIVGGELAGYGQFPFMAVINQNNRPACGGVIMNVNYVVTAGHCVHQSSGNRARFPPSAISVRVGSNRVRTGGRVYQVSQIKVHPNYALIIYDICLLRLAQPIQWVDRVRPAPFTTQRVRPGARVTVIGWGYTRTGGTMNDRMMYTELSGMSDAECHRHHHRHESVMCLGHPAGRGICQGDSGGPALVDNMVVGIMSFSSREGCGTTIPDGFARVSFLYGWLFSNNR